MTPTISLLLAASSPSAAYDDGVVGRSSTGCGACHGAAEARDVSVSLSVDADLIEPGDTVGLTLRIESEDGAHSNVGFDLAASGGRLAATSGVLLREGELTHSYPFSLTDGVYEQRFDWTAPAAAGEVRFTAAGNAVNYDSAASDIDGWSRGSLSVSVEEPDDDGGLDSGGDDGGWDSGGDDGGWDSGGDDGGSDSGGDDGGWDSGGDDGGWDSGGDDGGSDSGGSDSGGDDGGSDSGSTDSGSTDSGSTDSGSTDSGATDDSGPDGRADRAEEKSGACSMVGAPAGGLLLGLVSLVGLNRRRHPRIRA